MNSKRVVVRVSVAVLVAAFFTVAPTAAAQSKTSRATTTSRHFDYHGWKRSHLLGNGLVEAVIVPEVGRVMQFRFAGESDGLFWENRALDGKAPDATTNVWQNFGGDKTWPAPQADWPKVTPRIWPPPPAFDSMPAASLEIENAATGPVATMISQVDPYFGIRTRRRIWLEPGKPVMRIATTYEKIEGEPRKVAIWTITQLKDPLAVFAPVPWPSIFPQGYSVTMKEAPPSVQVEGSILSLRRDSAKAYKIGNDAGTLLWVGEKWAVRIDSPRVPGAEYTHSGNSAEIYTNPDAAPYVELELLGPLAMMKVGDNIERSNTYTLSRRSEATPEAEAKKILSR
ncbi:MAG: hypothetical protein HY300_14145 [Verrucomicrobia bacterium]|nr:hypothetical protein [Verrucomicrobiota bacterium]